MEILTNNTVSGVSEIANNVSTTINGIMGALAGVLALIIIVCGVYYGVRIGTSSDPEKRKKWISALKWLGISLVAILIIWGVLAIVTNVFTNTFTTQPSSGS